VPTGLKRYYGAGYLHFITFSCYRRRALLGSARNRDWFLEEFEHVRRRYRFLVAGYVIMPEHVHLLIGEPERGNPSVVLQVLKQRFSRHVRRPWQKREASNQMGLWSPESEDFQVWQRRFYDFVVWSEHKRVEKLRYMHRNPVKRGLVLEPEQWEWSSFRDYAHGQTGRVRVNAQPAAVLKINGRAADWTHKEVAG
jgi:putative transposase